MKSTPEAKKQELVADLTAARSEVLEAALALPPAAQEETFLGIWSAHDIVAHLVGWDHANLEAVEAIRAGRLPAFYTAYDPDWRTFNAGLVARHKRATLDQTIADAHMSHRALIEALEALPAGELDRDYGVRSARGRRVTIAMLLTVEARDERKHAAQIRAFAAQRKE
jgi:hypothetical protein